MPSAPNNEICRAQWHDYRAVGCYMLTASTHNRRPLLGALRGDSAAEAYVELSSLGQALAEAVRAIPDHFPEVEVKAFVVMPDHFHLQLFVARPMQRHLGAVMGWIKTETTKAYLHELNLRELALHVTPHEGDRYNQVRQQARIVTAMQANGVAGYEGVTLVRPAPSGLVEEVAAILRRRAQLQGGAQLSALPKPTDRPLPAALPPQSRCARWRPSSPGAITTASCATKTSVRPRCATSGRTPSVPGSRTARPVSGAVDFVN